MSLDHAVSRAVIRSRVLEAALHSRAPWFVVIGGVGKLAEVTRHESGVTFKACFELISSEAESVTLYEGQEFRLTRPFSYPGPGEFCVSWDLAMEERARA